MISDTHFSHSNILTFEIGEGRLLRPGFKNVEEMDETMIDNWNRVVKEQDKVYHLGDLCFSLKRMDAIMPRLNGNKRLLAGNHDLHKTARYLAHFKQVYGVRQIDGYWLTHVPMQDGSMYRAKLNIHGHLHEKVVVRPDGRPDMRYFNVSVEQINYTPINFETLRDFYENYVRDRFDYSNLLDNAKGAC